MQQTVPVSTMSPQVPAGYVLSAAPPETMNSPKTRPCFKSRLATAAVLTLLGVVTTICGIIVIFLRFPQNSDIPMVYNVSLDADIRERDHGVVIDQIDGQAWGIWMGMVMVLISLFGYFSKRNQTLISFYMASSILGALMAFVGLIVASNYLGRTVAFRNQLEQSMNTDFGRSGSLADRACEVTREYRNMEPEDPLVRERYNECLQLHIDAARAHLPFYIIMFICFATGFAVTIVGASSTCPGLNCCSQNENDRGGLVYLQQVGPQSIPQQNFYPQMNQQQMIPQTTVPNEPPPSYTSLIHESPNNRLTNGTTPSNNTTPAPVGANQAPPPVGASGPGGASIQPAVPGRRVPTSALPTPPVQPQTAPPYYELTVGAPQHKNPPVSTPESDSDYLAPDAAGPPHGDSTYLTPDAGGTYPGNTTYLEPNATRQVQHDNQNEAYQYDYADPKEELHQRPRAAGDAVGEYITVVP